MESLMMDSLYDTLSISKVFRVFNTRTRIIEENLHINFLENKPNVAGTGPNWMFDIDTLTMSMNYQPVFAGNQTNSNAGTKANIDVGQAGKKTVPGPQYVLLPLLTSDSQGLKSLEDEVADDAGKNSTEVPRKENGVQDPAKEVEDANTNSTNRLNTFSSPVNAVSSTFTTVDPGRERAQRNEFEIATLPNVDLSTDPLMPNLKDTADLQDTGIFSGAYDDEVEGAMANFNNLELTTVVSPIPTTKIHKDHPKEQIIGIDAQEVPDEFYGRTHFLFRVAVKTASTLIETNKALLKDEEAEDVDVHLYRSMIGSLMYLTTFRPNIMFAVYACSRDSPFDLEAFSDSDYAGASLDRKSTTGGCQFLGKRLISWQCKKQTVVANSTTKAEYVTAANCCGQAIAKCKRVNDVKQIHATIDGKTVVISESSVRSDLHFNDEDVVLNNQIDLAEPFNDVYVTPVHTKKLRVKVQGNPLNPPSSTTPPSHEEHVPTVASQPQKNHTPRRTKRGQDTEIPQSSGPLKKVGDEVVYTGEDDKVVRAATTATSLEAE
ncbi:hypothetical protein Tco_0077811 [Tanacetum coccineum]